MGERTVIQLRAEDELIEWLDRQAKIEHDDRSGVMRRILWAAKEADEKKAKRSRPRKASNR